MANLYEINRDITACVDVETGEIIDVEKLTELTLERDEKIENIALWIKNLKSDIEAYKSEITAFTERKRTAENKLEALTRYLSEFLDGKSFSTTKVNVSFRTTTSVKVNDGITLPEEYCRITTEISPDKPKIKEAIESRLEINGCELLRRRTMNVK